MFNERLLINLHIRRPISVLNCKYIYSLHVVPTQDQQRTPRHPRQRTHRAQHNPVQLQFPLLSRATQRALITREGGALVGARGIAVAIAAGVAAGGLIMIMMGLFEIYVSSSGVCIEYLSSDVR